MSNDKMREEFEAWRLREFCGGAERLKRCSNAPETYYYTAEQEAWKAWQASRAAPDVQGEPARHDWDEQDKCRRCGDRDWYAGPVCTPKQPIGEIGEVVVTKDKLGNIVSVTRQDAEGRILSVIAESEGISKSRVLAEGYFHPLPLDDDYEFHDVERFPEGNDCPVCIPAVIVRKSESENVARVSQPAEQQTAPVLSKFLEKEEWNDAFAQGFNAGFNSDEKPAPDVVADYEEVLAGHKCLTRELDVLLNGEEGAARQASLCDLVAQLRTVVRNTGKPVLAAL